MTALSTKQKVIFGGIALLVIGLSVGFATGYGFRSFRERTDFYGRHGFMMREDGRGFDGFGCGVAPGRGGRMGGYRTAPANPGQTQGRGSVQNAVPADPSQDAVSNGSDQNTSVPVTGGTQSQ